MRPPSLLLLLALLLPASAFCQDKLPSDGQIPVLAWYSIPPAETSVARYQELREAGITHSLSFFPDTESLLKALDAAGKAGVKLLANCREMYTEPEKTVLRLKNHPALAGYHLTDEPNISALAKWGELGHRIQAADPAHFCYLNLFPNFADTVKQLGTGNYRFYVSECARLVPLQFLSFDYYPILKDRISKTWYENLEQFSDESRKAGKPFWAFALTTNYDENHVTPQTLAAMRLQVYSNLAYGAQGIQYFTYWSATSVNAPSAEDQRGAPVSAAGKRSVVWDRVQQMSREIRNLSPVFLGSKVLWVRHAGKGMIPQGTVRLTKLPDPVRVLDAGGAPILVSLLEKGDRQFLVVVNKDFLNSISLTFYADGQVQKVQKDGSLVPANAYEPTTELEPGDAAVYTFKSDKAVIKK